MRAARITRPGPPDEVIELTDVDRPVPGRGEVRLAVEACALNHFDVFARRPEGDWTPDYPVITGGDVAGRVEAVGPDATIEVGQRVVVYPEIGCDECEWCDRGEATMCPRADAIGEGRPGGLAEAVVVPAKNCLPVPEGFPATRAAAWPIAFTTAWRLVVSAGDLGPGERALVLGASGGVGNAALQLADHVGATTFAATSSDEKARQLDPWADHVIDYTEVDFAEAVRDHTDGRGVDLVVDHVGKETWQSSVDSLAPGGRMTICGATSGSDAEVDVRSVYQSHRRIVGAPMGSKSDFRAVGRLVFEGAVEPLIHATLPLEDVAEGHRLLEERAVVGKVVVEP
ncbi:zinc-binding dehydrogenase [Halobacterium wangiae]|uniref:zinc-binding dehydrogenase n=1 Tax=Halobacterium wangiae TaxID=2902623 RepID=UPI001E4FFC2C|nr:zinc-binding dehydrogenase [Halobacterium wangiae]